MAAKYTGPRLALPGGLAEEIEDGIKRAGRSDRVRKASGLNHDTMREVLDCEQVPLQHLCRLADALEAAGVAALAPLAAEVRALVAGMEVAA